MHSGKIGEVAREKSGRILMLANGVFVRRSAALILVDSLCTVRTDAALGDFGQFKCIAKTVKATQ